MTNQLKRGDHVRVRLRPDDDWTRAITAVASDSDPSSVVLLLDGAVRDSRGGFIAKALPLTIDYGAGTVISLFGDPYEIEVAAEQPFYIVCPKCGMVSHNPNDVRERYCGNCHAFHDDLVEPKR
jgi:ribosomal protein S27AE